MGYSKRRIYAYGLAGIQSVESIIKNTGWGNFSIAVGELNGNLLFFICPSEYELKKLPITCFDYYASISTKFNINIKNIFKVKNAEALSHYKYVTDKEFKNSIKVNSDKTLFYGDNFGLDKELQVYWVKWTKY